jgi:hypothetical protein
MMSHGGLTEMRFAKPKNSRIPFDAFLVFDEMSTILTFWSTFKGLKDFDSRVSIQV